MTKFRPCIDIHDGYVKQIVGSSLNSGTGLKTNFTSEHSPAWFAELYKKDGITGGHVIMLGKGNSELAKSALMAYPGGLQVGGGITSENAIEYLEAGASHVIVTSWIFPNGKLDLDRIDTLSKKVGKDHLVLDLSCKRVSEPDDTPSWKIAINKWQTISDTEISPDTLDTLSSYCSEFLIHAADFEGKQQGMDEELIMFLAEYSPIQSTYAGGAKSIKDLERCKKLSNGGVDISIGSALDIFGGKGIKYSECVKFNRGIK